MQAGFSQVDITPQLGLPMWGMPGSPRATDGVKWPLHARIALFDDGSHRAAVVGLDLGALSAPVVAELREAIASGTSLAPMDVMLACSHTHNAPFCASVMDEDTDFEYVDLLRDRLAAGVRTALGSLQPVRLKVGSAQAPGWCFNRRTVYNLEDGRAHVGTIGPRGGERFASVEGPEDDELQVLLAEGADRQPVGGIVNYACHPTVMGGLPVYSADFAGPLTDALHDRYGCPFVHLTGAAGNLSPYSLVPGEPLVKGEAHALEMGVALAGKAGEALAGAEYVVGKPVRTARRVLSIAQRRPTKEQVRLARWYLEKAPEDIDQTAFTRQIYGHDYTFYSNSPGIQTWMVREIIGMWEWQRRVGTRELREEVEIQAIAVGEVASVAFPAEYFCEFGLELRARSPFAATFVAELANGWHGYVATEEAFRHGGYEPRFGYQSRLVPEAGYRMLEAAADLLTELARG